MDIHPKSSRLMMFLVVNVSDSVIPTVIYTDQLILCYFLLTLKKCTAVSRVSQIL